MLIRHAEKPQGDQVGIDAKGRQDNQSLTLRGWQRAFELPSLFSGNQPRSELRLARPELLFAARPTERHPSTRPRDTLLPLAESLQLSIDERWSTDDSAAEMAEHLHRSRRPVIVCWRHRYLPDLARHLAPTADVPPAWPEHRYDVLWKIELTEGGWRFAQVLQRLLADDGNEPIS